MRLLLLGLIVLFMGGCANLAFQNQTNCAGILICPEGPKIVPSSAHQLLSLPFPRNKAVVAVYEFPDLTGQRKGLENIASFSSAVTQGGMDIMI